MSPTLNTNPTVVLCKDCKHCQRISGPSSGWLCLRASTSTIDPVDGTVTLDKVPCHEARRPGQRCGISGNWWQAKESR
jgi:hypothetical protein